MHLIAYSISLSFYHLFIYLYIFIYSFIYYLSIIYLLLPPFIHKTAAGDAWSAHPWPAFFLRAPDLPVYQKSVPEQRLLSDLSGETEQVRKKGGEGGREGGENRGPNKKNHNNFAH